MQLVASLAKNEPENINVQQKNVTSSKVPFRLDEEGAEEKYRPASSKTWTYIGIRSRDFEPPRLSKSVLSRVEDRH